MNGAEIKVSDLLVFTYTNWKGKGEISKRKVIIQGFFFGSNEHYRESQCMIQGFDLGELANITFAAKNISEIKVIK